MPTIHYIQQDGSRLDIDVPVGSSVMQGAVDHMVEGILAECGGACSCATCQVYVDESWMPIVGEACDIEREMLDATPNVRVNSRLGCQIEITPELDGLVVIVPRES